LGHGQRADLRRIPRRVPCQGPFSGRPCCASSSFIRRAIVRRSLSASSTTGHGHAEVEPGIAGFAGGTIHDPRSSQRRSLPAPFVDT
jgi:hypothetical protein